MSDGFCADCLLPVSECECYDDDDYRDYECPDCGGLLGQSCICGDDLDDYNGMYAYEDWYKTLSPLRRLAEDVLRRTQNLRWRITWKLKEWWRENVRREELPF